MYMLRIQQIINKKYDWQLIMQHAHWGWVECMYM